MDLRQLRLWHFAQAVRAKARSKQDLIDPALKDHHERQSKFHCVAVTVLNDVTELKGIRVEDDYHKLLKETTEQGYDNNSYQEAAP